MWQDPRGLEKIEKLAVDGFEISNDVLTTRYLGKHTIEAKNLLGTSHGSEELHLFFNEYSFLDLEESYVKRGGAYGSKTIYLFRMKETHPNEDNYDIVFVDWQLIGVATTYRSGKPSIYANLGNTFTAIDSQTLESNEY
jgi:hypothetical protein